MTLSNENHRSKARVWFSNLSRTKQLLASVVTIAGGFLVLFQAYQVVVPRLVDLVSPDAMQQTELLGLQVWQGGEQNGIFAVGDDLPLRRYEVRVRQEPFELRLPERELINICAWNDDSIFSLKYGEKLRPDQCVHFANSLATSEAYAQRVLFLNKDGNSAYVGDRMVTAGGKNRIFVHEVQSVRYDPETYAAELGERIPMEELGHNLYFVVFINGDNDKIIDSDEYEYLELDFPAGN